MSITTPSRAESATREGFTLIELSIVLVIIALIVGGVLVGQDMINAAATRAQISQIEKYNTAVNTFKVKFGYLPGDIPDPYASGFGFIVRGTSAGQGDGNGIIESPHGCFAYQAVGSGLAAGEAVVFWSDLSRANLIDGSFNTVDEIGAANPSYTPSTTSPTLSAVLPAAKIGNGNYVQVLSGAPGSCANASEHTGINYFSVAAVTGMNMTASSSIPGMTVAQAFNIDTKIDDGFPQTGRVIAMYSSFYTSGNAFVGTADTSATAASSSTCYDNAYAGGAAATQHYSMQISKGSGVNCALSFQMQGAGR